MSEMMTAEAIIEAEWLLAGYWTKPRFALQTEADTGVILMCCHMNRKAGIWWCRNQKCRESRHAVFAYTEYTRETYGDILQYDGDQYFLPAPSAADL
jgi:hypothetical protein